MLEPFKGYLGGPGRVWGLGFGVSALGFWVLWSQGLVELGRALGHFTFSLIGLKRILFTNIFQRL